MSSSSTVDPAEEIAPGRAVWRAMPPSGRAWRHHFLATMVRAPRAVDLVANSAASSLPPL